MARNVESLRSKVCGNSPGGGLIRKLYREIFDEKQTTFVTYELVGLVFRKFTRGVTWTARLLIDMKAGIGHLAEKLHVVKLDETTVDPNDPGFPKSVCFFKIYMTDSVSNSKTKSDFDSDEASVREAER